jgi:hypothetical protein
MHKKIKPLKIKDLQGFIVARRGIEPLFQE